MPKSKLERVHDSIVSRLKFIKHDGYEWTFIKGRKAYLSRNGRVMKPMLMDLLLVECEDYNLN